MNKRNFLIDIILLIAFLIAMVPDLLGNTIHEWLGLALLAVFVVHLFLHWDWIIGVGSKFFKILWHSSRLKFFVDILAFIAFITVSLSGILISESALPALGLRIDQVGMAWKRLHSLSADASVLLIGLHFALNWSWVVCMFKQCVISPIGRLFRPNRVSKQSVQDIT